MLDCPVLTGGVHALQHDEQRPLVLRGEPLLQIAQALDVIHHHLLGAALVEVEMGRIGRIKVGKAEARGIVDPVMLEDFCNLHQSHST